MTVKEYLLQPQKLEEEIQRDEDNLAAMRSIVENRTTHLSHTAGCNPSKNKDSFEKVMLNITVLEDRIEQKRDRLTELKIEVLEKIMAVDDERAQDVLRMRFVEGKPMKVVYKALHFTKRHALRLQQKGIEELEKMSPDVTQGHRMSPPRHPCITV